MLSTSEWHYFQVIDSSACRKSCWWITKIETSRRRLRGWSQKSFLPMSLLFVVHSRSLHSQSNGQQGYQLIEKQKKSIGMSRQLKTWLWMIFGISLVPCMLTGGDGKRGRIDLQVFHLEYELAEHSMLACFVSCNPEFWQGGVVLVWPF